MHTSPCPCDNNFTHIILLAKTAMGFHVSGVLMVYDGYLT